LSRGRTERFEYQGDWSIGETVRAVFGAEQEHSRISDGFSRSATRITSGYAQLIARPTSAMTLTGGVRHDDHRDYGGNTTLSGNAVWELDNGLTLRAAYAEGYKSPTLFQLNSFFGNIQLQPERARSYEAGVAWSGGPYFSASATLYRRDTRNQIDFISCFGQSTGICTGRPFGTYDNIDRTKAQGIELEVRISPVSEVAITANYTLTDTADKASGLSLLRRPRHRINLDGDWTVARWLRLGAALQLSSDSADVDFQTFARTRLDGYVLASVRAAVPIGRRFELFGRAENLGNVRYETVSGYGSYGRTAHMGVRARF
jgi:vitamin B12 transporter